MHIPETLKEDENFRITRISVPELDEILGKKFPVLDKGFVRLIDYMGNDSSVVQAARVSYGSGTKSVNEDAGLINFLFRHKHTSPFEMCEIKLHVKMPLFVARQWVRHRTASLNEMSARYSIVPDEYFIPFPEACKSQDSINKQGSAQQLDKQMAMDAVGAIDQSSLDSFNNYKKLLEIGLSREIARTVLPQNMYTQMYWKIDLHNLLHFIALRSSEKAQPEIKAYADVILEEILKKWTPLCYDAFKNYRKGGMYFSSKQLEELKKTLDQSKVREFINNHKTGRGELREMASELEKFLQ